MAKNTTDLTELHMYLKETRLKLQEEGKDVNLGELYERAVEAEDLCMGIFKSSRGEL